MNYLELQKKYDKANLYQDLTNFYQQFSTALEYIKKNPITGNKNVQNVIVCGMGGSSLPADIINNIQSKVPVHTCRTYTLPEWVDSNTLVIISSYSGNTEETISALEEAKKRTDNIVVTTSGGRILEEAKTHKYQHLVIPTGFQPRIATGYFVTYMLYILSQYHLVADQTESIQQTQDFMSTQDYQQRAQDVVDKIGDKLPILYTTQDYSSVARINKIKINENGKTQAFWYTIPEMNHNEMAGFTNMRINPVFIIFHGRHAHPRNKKRIEIFEEIMSSIGSFINIPMNGPNKLTEVMDALCLGDWISYYIALKSEIDPSPVDAVENFKKLLK